MKKEEAIELLKLQISSAEFYARYTNNDKDAEKELKDAEAFRMAIEALSSDVVSREKYEELYRKTKEINEMANDILANFPSYEEVVSVVQCIERCSRGERKDSDDLIIKEAKPQRKTAG